MEHDPAVFIIILHYNRLDDTLECLESVYKNNYTNYKVVVVNNVPSDDPVNIVRERYPEAITINNKKNLGFTGGNNVGIRYAIENGADYVWLLNNDTEIGEDCLRKMVEKAESSGSIAVVSPAVHYFEDPERIQFSGCCMDWHQFRLLYPDLKKPIDAKFVCGENTCLWGTALLIKAGVIKKIGLLTEDFFAYWEGIEYSLRVIKNGMRNVVCDVARIYHKRQSPMVSGEKGLHYYYFMNRNFLLLGDRYIRGKIRRLRFKIRGLAEASDHVGNHRRSDIIDASLDGTWHGLRNFRGPLVINDGMPKSLKNILKAISGCHPVFISDVITFNFRQISSKIYNKYRSD